MLKEGNEETPNEEEWWFGDKGRSQKFRVAEMAMAQGLSRLKRRELG